MLFSIHLSLYLLSRPKYDTVAMFRRFLALFVEPKITALAVMIFRSTFSLATRRCEVSVQRRNAWITWH